MTPRGQNEGMRVLDDFVCEAIRGPTVSDAAEAGWSQDDVFPLIARAIEVLSGPNSDYADHDAIVRALLDSPDARPLIESAVTAEHSPQWVAHNMVAWFSQRISVRQSPWAKRFERQKINGKWAYRVAKAS
jgi:hypothetical protein